MQESLTSVPIEQRMACRDGLAKVDAFDAADGDELELAFGEADSQHELGNLRDYEIVPLLAPGDKLEFVHCDDEILDA